MSELRFAPGCFGSPLCYKLGHPVCTPCGFAKACAPIAAERLLVLHAHFGVKRKPAPKIVALKPAPNPKLVFIGKALRAGKNPFNSKIEGQKPWWLIVEILLRKPAHATIKAFAVVIAKLLNSLKRAIEHVSKVMSELMRTGVIVKRGELFAIT